MGNKGQDMVVCWPMSLLAQWHVMCGCDVSDTSSTDDYAGLNIPLTLSVKKETLETSWPSSRQIFS